MSKKIDRAIEIVTSSPSKEHALNLIIDELKVTRANAFVYYTKAQKTLGTTTVQEPSEQEQAVA